MPSGKLRLKLSLEEKAERKRRKAYKAARKASRQEPTRQASPTHDPPSPSHKRRRTTSTSAQWDSDSSAEYGPPPPPSAGPSNHRAHKPDLDYANIQARVEEERFREKMWGALEDDERLDAVEARMNAFAHIPRRWQNSEAVDDEQGVNPQYMEDEEYAEWIRAGMWRKQHAAEFAEEARQQVERAARAEREKAARAEAARLERIAEEERQYRRRKKERMREEAARERYEAQWTQLLSVDYITEEELSFADIPWPVLPSEKADGEDDLSTEDISAFLFVHRRRGDEREITDKEERKSADRKARRDRLRETMLRFHPDKFEGRLIGRVKVADRERVMEAVGRVARALNSLMKEQT